MTPHLKGRILAIDYGMKRLGIAITDPEQLIATPLIALPSQALFSFLTTYLQQEYVVSFVLGMPKGLDGKDTPMSLRIEQLGQRLQKTFPQQALYYHDERFTSKIAMQSLYQAGYPKKTRQQKANIDKISATIILQSFLNSIKKPLNPAL